MRCQCELANLMQFISSSCDCQMLTATDSDWVWVWVGTGLDWDWSGVECLGMGQLIALVARASSRESLTCSSCCAISSSQVFVPGLISAQLTRIVESVSIVIMRVTPRGKGGSVATTTTLTAATKAVHYAAIAG